MLAHDLAVSAGGTFLLRIEDIDQSRARAKWEAQIYDDLAWLGLKWPLPVLRQSDRLNTYADALDTLWHRGLLYVCTCTRADIAAAGAAPQEGAPLLGPDGVVYPGTCKEQPAAPHLPKPQNAVLRLNMTKALHDLGDGKNTTITFTETGDPAHRRDVAYTAETIIRTVGDVVLARRDMGTSYHLSVVLDDATQHISHVVRGADLFDATVIHVILQRLLRLSTPIYHHHTLIRDDAGKRLAKRDDARAISLFLAEGATPADIRAMVGL